MKKIKLEESTRGRTRQDIDRIVADLMGELDSRKFSERGQISDQADRSIDRSLKQFRELLADQ